MTKRTKGTCQKPFVCYVYGTLRARRGKTLKEEDYAGCACVCVCVCVSKISEAAKYKPLKSAEKSTSLHSTCSLALFIFVFANIFTPTRRVS